jgi:Superfamily II DNA/RNA helicases, SNF2 family
MNFIILFYRFISADTIEQKIKTLQTQKLALASSVLTGTKQRGGNKLSLDDLKMLFNFSVPASLA